ncbi:MAG TPA: M56 family metallopeptidase [Blastocatellia bacterium]|nr:M56 family metallopeptidase [Blastocatellia bacterium]
MHGLPTVLDKPLFQILGWTLIHFLWQGALVALALSLANLLLRSRGANLRYAAACLSLLLLILLPLATFSILSSSGSASVTITDSRLQPPPIEHWSFAKNGITSSAAGLPANSGAAVSSSSSARDAIASVDSAPVMQRLRTGLVQRLPWLVLIWLLGVAVLSIRFIAGLRAVRRLKSEATDIPAPQWQSKLQRLRRALRISRPVRLCETVLVQVPTVVGWFRPLILLPATALTGMSPEQLEALLAHELAHIRRHDYLVNIAQTTIETLLFYHPAVWWVSHQIRYERENCCDDMAVAACGDLLTYARALADLERLRSSIPYPAVAASGGSLLKRIERLVGVARPERHQAGPQLAGLAVIAAALIVLAVAGDAIPTRASGASISKIAALLPIGRQQDRAKTERAGDNDKMAATARQSRERELQPNPPDDSEMNYAASSDSAIQESIEQDSDSRQRLSDRDERQGSGQADSKDFIGDLSALGYKDLSVDQLVALKSQGVTAEFVKEMKELGYDKLSISQLIELFSQGVAPGYVRSLAAAGYSNLSVDELIVLKVQGIVPNYLKEMKEAGFARLPVNQLIALRVQGVNQDYARQMEKIGFKNLTPEELISLKIQGVSADYVRQIHDLGLGELSLDHVIAMSVQGVSAQYIRQMKELGLKDLTSSSILALKVQGVSPNYIAAISAGGLGRLPIDQILEMKVQGISPDYIKQMRSLELGELSASELVEMRIQGVSAAYVEGMRAAGYDKLTVPELTSMRIQGITPEFAKEIKSAGYPGVSIHELMQMRIFGITPQFIKRMKTRGFKDLNVRQLIELKNAGIR